MPELSPADLDVEDPGLPHSCYLLEFAVGSGGARMGDVYAGTTVDGLRATIAARFQGHGLDDYLIIWYGAVLHLWVVQEGVIVEGVDLHPYLRTGDARCDRTLARVIERRQERGDRWREIDRVLDPYDFAMAPALPLLTRVLELQDRLAADPADTEARAALDRVLAAAADKEAPPSHDGMTVDGLDLDWDALAALVPPLREPLLTSGRVSVRWADPAMRPRDSYLDSTEPESLRLGVNDLENGDDD